MTQPPAAPPKTGTRNVVEATGTDVGSMEALRNQRQFEADTKKGQGERLRTAVGIHPALAAQVKAENDAKPAAETKTEEKPAETKSRDDKGQFTKSQEENFASLREVVKATQARAEAAEARLKALEAKPAEPAKPLVDPISEAMSKVLEKIPVEHKDYWQKTVLPSIAEVVRPVHEENRSIKAELDRRDSEAKKTQALSLEVKRWGMDKGMDNAQLQEVVGKVFEEGLDPILDTNPHAALNAAMGLLGLGKKTSADPEAQKKAADAAKAQEDADNRARAKAGGVDAAAAGPTPSGSETVDFSRLIKEAETRGDRQEALRLHNLRFRSAAGIDPEWLAGRKVILGPE